MKRFRSVLQQAIPPLLTTIMVVALWFAWHMLFESAAPPEENETLAEERTQVELSPIKLARAGIKTERAMMADLQDSAWVPGRITYDKTKHINLRAATAGNIQSFHVKPGDRVEKGDLLVIVRFPEIGQSRATEKQQLAELQLQEKQLAFLQERRTGIVQLIAAIKDGQPLDSIREKYTEDEIGAAREPLLAAYAQQLLTKTQLDRIVAVAASGAVSERTVAERNAQFESADAALRGNMEQLVFDADQEVARAQAAVESTRRQIEVTRQQTATLMGYLSFSDLPHVEGVPDSELANVQIRAPIAGTVEQLTLADAERINADESLLILADTRVLWVEAQVRESHWQAIALKQGDDLSVTSPAFKEELKANVHFVGRSVDPISNSVPIVATVYNDGRLRPGLFVNVRLPLGAKRTCLTVPESAISVHEGESFVFVPANENLFVRRNVNLGQASDGRVEILSGLTADDEVVIAGSFFLKSELLLEAEE